MPDKSITADDILSLLAERYGDAQKYACATEVSPRTGAWNRRIDFLAAHCWESESFNIEGFEIKISKSDMKRELMEPDKHACFFDDIDYYWMVAPDYVLDDLSILPNKWGVMKVVSDEDGKLSLKICRKPICLHDDKINSRKCSRPFLASLCRAIQNRGIAKANAWREKDKLEKEIREKIELEMSNGARIVSAWDYDKMKRCQDICDKLDVSYWYGGLSEWQLKAFREAKNIAEKMRLLDTRLKTVGSEVRIIRSVLKGLVNGEDASKSISTAWSCIEKKVGDAKGDDNGED